MEASTKNLCQTVEAVNLPSVDPVEDVEEAVEAEGGNVVRGDVLDDSYLIEHNNLGKESE